LAAENSSPTTTSTSSGPRSASYEATQQGAGPLPEARTSLAALTVVLKWVGVALLIVACLLAVYLGAALLGELAVRATYP
jgi:hypothetical protein